MQIQQSAQTIAGIVQTIPSQILAGMVIGQQIEAAVIQASLAAQIVSLKIGGNVIQVTTPVPLKQGQAVQLELVQGGDKPVLKLIPPAVALGAMARVKANPISLVPGQQVVVEVIKLLTENRLLVQSTDLRQPSASGQLRHIQFDVDITQVAKSFALGEKALVEVLTIKPLAIVLKAAPLAREQLVINKIKQLLPQLEAKPQLTQVMTALKSGVLPSSVQSKIQQLVVHIVDKRAVNQPQVLKQAIESAGIFTERQLLKPNANLSNDFKANLLKVAAVIAGELSGKPTQSNISPMANNILATSSPLNGSLGKSQLSVSNMVNSKPLSLLSISSLGKSQLSVSKLVVSNAPPSVINKTVVHGEKEISGKPPALSSPFSSQNNAKVSEPKIQAGSDFKLTLLSSVLQAVRSYNATPSTVSVLNTSPSSTGLPTSLPAFLDTILTSQQAAVLVQALNKSIFVEQSRANSQFDMLVLQGLLKEVESLHTRVQLNQFSMLKDLDSPGAPVASWLIDLPVKDKRDIDFIQLQFDQFKNQNQDGEDEIWSVQLRLDTENLGPVQATVTMHIEDIKIVLRAERPDSAVLLENHIAWLRDALMRLGVSVSHVSCSCGQVAKPTLAEQYLAETNNLVDVSV
ncbi:MAG: hypothetical protein ACI9QV_000804 [Methylophagaceae bacterium]|jgi:hypothetical protein